jgi:hypothetical protein
MHYLRILLAAAFACACAPTLKVTVQRYDLDGAVCANPADKSCAHRAFADARGPTPESAYAEMEKLRQAVSAYGARLKQLNRITNSLMMQPAAGKDGTIDKHVDVTLDAIASAANSAMALQSTAETNTKALTQLTTDVFNKTFGLENALRDANVVLASDTDRIATVMLELEKGGNPTLLANVATARKALAEVPEPPACPAPAQPTGSAPQQMRAWLPSFLAAVTTCQQNTKDQAGNLLAANDADGVRREHVISQNMADPFLAFLAAHPEAWSKPENLNQADVTGDGDTEFVLVLDQGLDGRWKSVTVDPTKVIQARLKIGRSVAFAAAAFLGSAAGGIGIPLPKNVEIGGSSDTDPSISKVAAETKWIELENDRTRAELARLHAALVKIQSDLDATGTTKPNYVNIRGQLQRLVSGFSSPAEPTNP